MVKSPMFLLWMLAAILNGQADVDGIDEPIEVTSKIESIVDEGSSSETAALKLVLPQSSFEVIRHQEIKINVKLVNSTDSALTPDRIGLSCGCAKGSFDRGELSGPSGIIVG